MKLSTPVIAIVLSLTATAAAQAPSERDPVVLRLVGDDGLSQKLSYELEEGLRRDNQLRAATREDQSPIVIQSERNVAWDELDGRKVAMAIVYVYRSEDVRGDPVIRVCWENAMQKCARDILSVARRWSNVR